MFLSHNPLRQAWSLPIFEPSGPSSTHHGCDLIEALQELHNLGLVGGLHTGEAAGSLAGLPLLSGGQVVKLAAGVGPAGHLLSLGEDADAAADGDGRAFVVPGDHDDADAGLPTQLDGAHHLFAGWVQHAHAAHKGQVRLRAEEGSGQPGKSAKIISPLRFPPLQRSFSH